jgi:hypothetical protein
LGDAPGDEAVPDPPSSPGAAGAELRVPIDCVAPPAVPDGGALVHPVTPAVARTARAASALTRAELEAFISGFLMIARY